MARTLRIDTAASPSLLLQRARRAARANGVLLLGDENSGRFSHRMLEGTYRRQGPTLIVTITHKHRLVPWSVLEGRLRGLFGGGPPRTERVIDKPKAPMKKSKAPTARRTGDGEGPLAGIRSITGISIVAGPRTMGESPPKRSFPAFSAVRGTRYSSVAFAVPCSSTIFSPSIISKVKRAMPLSLPLHSK